MQLPEQQHPRPGQPTDTARDLINAVEEALAARHATAYRDDSPLPVTGTTPPVPQPGRPPMSPRAVDINTTILTSSVLIAAVGASGTGVLWGSGHANAEAIAWICGSIVAIPAALTLPVLALKGLMKSAKKAVQAAPAPVHHHYNGTVHVDQRAIHATTRGVIAHTRNHLPK